MGPAADASADLDRLGSLGPADIHRDGVGDDESGWLVRKSIQSWTEFPAPAFAAGTHVAVWSGIARCAMTMTSGNGATLLATRSYARALSAWFLLSRPGSGGSARAGSWSTCRSPAASETWRHHVSGHAPRRRGSVSGVGMVARASQPGVGRSGSAAGRRRPVAPEFAPNTLIPDDGDHDDRRDGEERLEIVAHVGIPPRRRHGGVAATDVRCGRQRSRRPGQGLRSDRRRASGRGCVRCRVRASCRTTSFDRAASVSFEGCPHGAMGVMETGAGGAGRDAEFFGDLRRGEARVVVEHEDGPLFGRKTSEPTFELVSIGDPEELVGCRRPIDRQDRRFVTRRRSRVASAMHWWTRRRCSHASNRSGSRSPRRSRQAITSASWRTSSARSTSRRNRWATANSRSLRERIRSTYASRSPRCAAATRSRSTCAAFVQALVGSAFR